MNKVTSTSKGLCLPTYNYFMMKREKRRGEERWEEERRREWKRYLVPVELFGRDQCNRCVPQCLRWLPKEPTRGKRLSIFLLLC